MLMSMITNIPTPTGTRNTAMRISISTPTIIRTSIRMSTNIWAPHPNTIMSIAGNTAIIPTITPATIKRPIVMSTAKEKRKEAWGIRR